ncbi:hypothetical protein [Muricoccus radiodurans]|uniref:hypothetical protein n=1 Tax=Muricoccus radiodurans TaxID=2231721 RepID=UPI003CF3429B
MPLDVLVKRMEFPELNGFNANFEEDRALAESLADAAQTVAERQLGIQERLLAQSEAQTNLLAALGGGATGGNANDRLVSALMIGSYKMVNAQIDAIFASAGVTVAPGGGRRTAFLNDSANAKLNGIFKAFGVPGFANGGLITGGISGMDSVPTLHMPGESTIRTPSVQSLGLPALQQMNATGRLPANDNGAEITALRREVQTLTRVVAASGQMQAEALAGIRTSNARTAEATEQLAARR